MKKLLLSAVTAAVLATGAQAEYNRYAAIGITNVSYDQSNYSDGKGVHVKLGLQQDEGFGMEFEYMQTIDPLSSTEDLDVKTYATYAAYKVMMNGEFALKGRLGFLDQSYDFSVSGIHEENTDVSYGLSINYEPVQDQIIYVDYTVTKNGWWHELTTFSVGLEYPF